MQLPDWAIRILTGRQRSDQRRARHDQFVPLTVRRLEDRRVLNGSPVTITGATAVNNTTDKATAQPFSSVTVDDSANPADILTVSVTLDAAAKGTFTTLNGFSNA